jgi:hypothetical protein
MKISQIMTSSGPTEEGLPPLQAMLLEELTRRPDEVFEYNDEGLLRIFPRLKRSALSWSFWSLHKRALIAKQRLRVNGKLTTVFGSHEAIEALKEHLKARD